MIVVFVCRFVWGWCIGSFIFVLQFIGLTIGMVWVLLYALLVGWSVGQGHLFGRLWQGYTVCGGVYCVCYNSLYGFLILCLFDLVWLVCQGLVCGLARFSFHYLSWLLVYIVFGISCIRYMWVVMQSCMAVVLCFYSNALCLVGWLYIPFVSFFFRLYFPFYVGLVCFVSEIVSCFWRRLFGYFV